MRFQSEIAQNIAEGISMVRAEDGVIVYANDKFEQIFGYESGELDGKHVAILNAPADNTAEEISEKVVKVLIKDGQWDGEVKNVKKDGSLFWTYAAVSVFQHPEYGTVWLGAQRDISEQKQAEEALHDSEKQYKTLTEISPVGVFRTDAKGKCTFVNEQWSHMAGLTFEDAMDEGWTRSLHPDDRESVYKEWAHCAQNDIVFQAEYRFKRPDGHVSWVFGQAAAETDNAGKIAGYVGTVTDITERKQAEEALQQSEEKYRQLIEGTEEEYFFYTHDVDGVFTYMSPSIQNVLGYPPEEYLIHYNDTFTDNPINQVASEKSEASIQGDRQPTYEVEVRRKDNSICRLAVTESPIFNKAGEVVAVEGIAHDITEQRLAEEALALTQARHEEAQRIAHLGHWTLDLITNELIWSDENYRIFGVEPGSVITYDTFLKTVHPDDREFVDYAYANSLINRTPFEIEHRLVMKDGSIKWVNERCETEYADDGSPLRSIGTTLNITERRQLKDTLYFTAQRGWDVGGEDFFKALATHLAKSLQIDFVIIGKLLDPKRVKTVALYAKGKTGNNIEYPLRHTPCGEVVGNDLCYYPQGIQQLFPLDEMLVEMGAESYLGIPLWDSKGEPIGLIALMDSKPMTNESRAKALLQIVAVRVVAELERRGSDEILEQSRKQLRALVEHIQAVREEEQKRIARDIHDDLGQLLTAINIDVSWIEEMLAEEQKDLRAKAQGASALVSAAIGKVQKISSTLRPTLLDDLGITAAIEWQINEFQNRTGIRVRFVSTPAEIEIADNLATEIYRIFQEALTNVIRHAEASTVEVDLTKSNERVILKVSDDGRGITEEEINNSQSIGLIGIRERAYSLQGDVAIHGKPGKGSSVIVTFPTGGKR
jgi:PAS domain S-box-containing protein